MKDVNNAKQKNENMQFVQVANGNKWTAAHEKVDFVKAIMKSVGVTNKEIAAIGTFEFTPLGRGFS